MGVIVDTSVWVDVERGRISPADVVAVVGREPVYLTPVTIAELQYGVEAAASASERARRAAALLRLRGKPCLAIDAATGEILGRMNAQLASRGRSTRHRIGDLWMASLALQHNMGLLTGNRRDFEDIPGLKLLSLS